MKNNKIIILLLAVAIILAGATYVSNGNGDTRNAESDTPTPTTVQEVIDTIISYTAIEGESVLNQLVAQNPTVVIEDSSFGQYVSSINDLAGGMEGKYWLFYVNGAAATVGASEYITHEGDRIEWRFE
ncbi:DUF4430 domain-containing protein [candidate division WWE3 bacterium]|uniref:DUF4430 domain-containing protein n=1 Tax=candidate division WWE3 bacterium TaxID=2053526 RepID=A0A955RRN4_UNCKA|nr:DUF4430 domain-containing protein [candidate division WWE3 bacterium]